MKTTLFSLAVFTFLALQFSCIREPEYVTPDPPVYVKDTFDCQLKKPDSLELLNGLVGKWAMIRIEIGQTQTVIDSAGLQNYQVEFKDDHTVLVTKNGVLINTSAWTIEKFQEVFLSVRTTPYVGSLYGPIFYCPGRVVFNGDVVDLGDHYFKRIE